MQHTQPYISFLLDLYLFIKFHYPSRIPNYYGIIWNIFHNDCTSSNSYIISDFYISNNYNICTYLNIITKLWGFVCYKICTYSRILPNPTIISKYRILINDNSNEM